MTRQTKHTKASVRTVSHHGKSKPQPTLTLVQITCIVVAAGLITGSVFLMKEFMETSRLLSQVEQIQEYDSATATFYDKYGGIPGDLLSVQAKRFGLPAGDGTPAHSDGDGKISPCNLGMQWNLGCETALFWPQLNKAGFIIGTGTFSADIQFHDYRLFRVGEMFPYLPQSSLGENIFITVWNTDPAQISPSPRIPYGNYYEISRITGVANERLQDNSFAISPAQAYSIDQKMDDGTPATGRVLVNGDANWPVDAWGTFAHYDTNTCVTQDHLYNIYAKAYARQPLCHLAVAFTCCAREE